MTPLKSSNEAKAFFFRHYEYITGMVKKKTIRYGLDYDQCLNYVLDRLCQHGYRKIQAFNHRCKFTTYITVVVHRLIISYARKKRKIPSLPAFTSQTPLDILINRQDNKCHDRFLQEFPKLLENMGWEERLILKLKIYKDFNISQIARQLGTTPYRVRKIYNRCLVYLQQEAKEICGQ